MKEFLADIIQDTVGRLTYIELPFNAKDVFQKDKGSIYVSGTINEIPYRSRLLSRGNGNYIMNINKSMQKAIGFYEEIITVRVTMCLDDIGAVHESKKEPVLAACNMDVITAIKTRQSIRNFISKPISEGILHTILCTGLYAPTAKNKRPYHFIVIKNREILSELASENTNAVMLCTAPCAIVVCGDRNKEGMKEFLYSDCAAATQNMLLAIHGLGLGGVWCGVAEHSNWQKLLINKLELPVKVEPIAVVAFGFTDEIKEYGQRWEPEKIHYDKW